MYKYVSDINERRIAERLQPLNPNYSRTHLPPIFLDMFIKNNTVHDHETRHADDFRIPIWHCEAKKSSVSVQGAAIWNDVPDNIKNVVLWKLSNFPLRDT